MAAQGAERVPALRVPHADDAVGAGGGDEASVARDGDGLHLHRPARERAEAPRLVHAPEPDRVVFADRQGAAVVAGEGDAGHPARVAAERRCLLPRFRRFFCHSLSVLSQLPEMSRVPVAEKATLVTASLWPGKVCAIVQAESLGLLLHAPDLRELVAAARREQQPVWGGGECDGRHGDVMGLDRRRLRQCLGVEEPDGPVPVPARDPLAVGRGRRRSGTSAWARCRQP